MHHETDDRRRATAAGLCALAAPVWALLVLLLAGAAAPYSHVSQYISELGAAGAPHAGWVAAAGFAPTGLLVLAFVTWASRALPSARRVTAGLVGLGAVGAAYVASAIFPCDRGCPDAGSVSQTVHNAFGLLEYAGAVAGLLLLASALRRSNRFAALSRLGVAASVLVALGFFAMLTPALAPVRGLCQRVAEAGIFLWIGAAGVLLLRLPARTPVSQPISAAPAASRPTRWRVVRRDDHGNRFEVVGGLGEDEARHRVAELESRGHKQSYEVERESEQEAGRSDLR